MSQKLPKLQTGKIGNQTIEQSMLLHRRIVPGSDIEHEMSPLKS